MFNWNDIINQYTIKHCNRIQKVTQPLRDHFGIDFFTYHRIDSSGHYTVLVDRPDWAEHYVSEQYFLQDPYLRHPRVYQSGICLVDSHGSLDYQEQVLKGGEAFHMDTGLVLIHRCGDVVEFFGCGANRETSSINHLFFNEGGLLRAFGEHFKRELQDLIVKMEKEPIFLPSLKGKDFHHREKIGSTMSCDRREAFLDDIGLGEMAKKSFLLTPRERECLHHFLQGKTAGETADILSLSSRTVEFYFDNIKDKLGCLSKREVLAVAKHFNEFGLL